jgi:hypothetical protein
MNYARLESSPRLQRTLKFLRRNRRWVSTREIIHGADVCAVNSIISELRANKFLIPKRCRGRGVYEYRYEGRVA